MASHYNSFRHEPEIASEEAAPDRGRRWGAAAWGWLAALALYFAWESAAYRGLFAIAAEWQFAHFDRDYPTLTIAALIALFGWPALLLRRRTDRDEGAERAGRGSMHALFGIAAGLALAAATALGWTLALPGDAGPSRVVGSAGPVQDGPAVLPGDARFGRVASFGRGILFLRHHALYAPVLGRGGVRTVVELDGMRPARRGILVHAELPGPLVRLYAALGYRMAARPAVLYASAATLRWPYYLAALQFGIAALGLALAGWWQRRHVRRRSRDTELTTA